MFNNQQDTIFAKNKNFCYKKVSVSTQNGAVQSVIIEWSAKRKLSGQK